VTTPPSVAPRRVSGPNMEQQCPVCLWSWTPVAPFCSCSGVCTGVLVTMVVFGDDGAVAEDFYCTQDMGLTQV
jgi:hypothetical protein